MDMFQIILILTGSIVVVYLVALYLIDEANEAKKTKKVIEERNAANRRKTLEFFKNSFKKDGLTNV